MVLQRRYSPRRLRDFDDDEENPSCDLWKSLHLMLSDRMFHSRRGVLPWITLMLRPGPLWDSLQFPTETVATYLQLQ